MTLPSLASLLFPISNYHRGFTTNPTIDLPGIDHIKLSDDALCLHKSSSRTTHTIVIPPAPSKPQEIPSPELAYEAFYPPGGLHPSSLLPSGFSCYLSGPPWFAKSAHGAREVLWSYRVMFEEEWEPALGGKLPGVYGGVGDNAYNCTGGRQDRCNCFSLRLMWRHVSILFLPFRSLAQVRQQSKNGG